MFFTDALILMMMMMMTMMRKVLPAVAVLCAVLAVTSAAGTDTCPTCISTGQKWCINSCVPAESTCSSSFVFETANSCPMEKYNSFADKEKIGSSSQYRGLCMTALSTDGEFTLYGDSIGQLQVYKYNSLKTNLDGPVASNGDFKVAISSKAAVYIDNDLSEPVSSRKSRLNFYTTTSDWDSKSSKQTVQTEVLFSVVIDMQLLSNVPDYYSVLVIAYVSWTDAMGSIGIYTLKNSDGNWKMETTISMKNTVGSSIFRDSEKVYLQSILVAADCSWIAVPVKEALDDDKKVIYKNTFIVFTRGDSMMAWSHKTVDPSSSTALTTAPRSIVGTFDGLTLVAEADVDLTSTTLTINSYRGLPTSATVVNTVSFQDGYFTGSGYMSPFSTRDSVIVRTDKKIIAIRVSDLKTIAETDKDSYEEIAAGAGRFFGDQKDSNDCVLYQRTLTYVAPVPPPMPTPTPATGSKDVRVKISVTFSNDDLAVTYAAADYAQQGIIRKGICDSILRTISADASVTDGSCFVSSIVKGSSVASTTTSGKSAKTEADLKLLTETTAFRTSLETAVKEEKQVTDFVPATKLGVDSLSSEVEVNGSEWVTISVMMAAVMAALSSMAMTSM